MQRQVFELQKKKDITGSEKGCPEKAGMSFSAAQAPKSVSDYLRISRSMAAEANVRHSLAEETVKRAGMDEEPADEMDTLFEDEDANIQHESMPAMPKRLPGCHDSMSAPVTATPKKGKAASAAGSGSAATTAVPSSGGLPSLALTMDGSSQGHGAHSAAGSSKASKANDLDESMAMVADKHLQTDKGASVKALYGLQPGLFLVPSEKRYAQSAKLRGASWILFMEFMVG